MKLRFLIAGISLLLSSPWITRLIVGMSGYESVSGIMIYTIIGFVSGCSCTFGVFKK